MQRHCYRAKLSGVVTTCHAPEKKNKLTTPQQSWDRHITAAVVGVQSSDADVRSPVAKAARTMASTASIFVTKTVVGDLTRVPDLARRGEGSEHLVVASYGSI